MVCCVVQICTQLQQRLQEYKAENEQLEELLQQEVRSGPAAHTQAMS